MKISNKLNEYRYALEDLKLRSDAADAAVVHIGERDTADESYDRLKEAIDALEILAGNCEVQDHPDMFFYRSQPERVLIDLRYLVDDGGYKKLLSAEELETNNERYNKVKRALGLEEYHE